MAASDYIVKIMYPQECTHADPRLDRLVFTYLCFSPDLPATATVEANLIVKVKDAAGTVTTTRIAGHKVAHPGSTMYDAVYWFDISKRADLVASDIWKIDIIVREAKEVVGHASVCLGRGTEPGQAQMLARARAVAGKVGIIHPFDAIICQPAPNGGTTTVCQSFQTLGTVDPSTSPVTSYVQLKSAPYTVTAGIALATVPFPYNWGFQYTSLPTGNYTLNVIAMINGVPRPSTMDITVVAC